MSAYSRRSPERPVDYCLLSSLNDAPASSSSSSSLVSASPPPSLSSVPPGFSASVAFRSLGRRREAGRAAQNSEPSGKRERSRGRTLRCEHGALRAAEEKRRARLSEDETARLNAEENAMDWDVPPPASSADYQAAAEDAPVLTLGSRRGTCAQDGNCLQRVCAWLAHACCGVQPQYQERLLYLDGRTVPQYFPSNAIKNTKYNVFTFLPMVLMQQFKFFFNLFYLAVALAQLLPLLQVGPLFTYLAPLAFVLFVTLAKEAYDDYKRYVRDREMNEQGYKRLTPEGTKDVMAAKIEVGDIIQIEANQRVPADVVFLRTTDKSGSCFIRTDQLDGETDWKLRRAVHCTQRLSSPGDLCRATGWCHVEAPRQDIDEFTGKFVLTRAPSPAPPAPPLASFGADGDCGCESRLEAGELDGDRQTEGEKKNCEEEQLMVSAHGGRTTRDGEQPIVEGLTLDNVLWANTVVASGSVLGLAIYTGKETRATMNASQATMKVGQFDLEVNLMSKVLFGILALLAFVLVALRRLEGIWPIYFLRFVLLLSSIIPVSLQVNLVMAKTLYSIFIMRDRRMKDTVVRTSTLPEELGRIDFLFSDKTGTLTRNEMHFKRLHIGRAMFAEDGLTELRIFLESYFLRSHPVSPANADQPSWRDRERARTGERERGRELGGRRGEVVHAAVEAIRALSLCHNVTPVKDEDSQITFQAASPDEVALVTFARDIGVKLVHRDEHCIRLEVPGGAALEYSVLTTFPFSSETKRMGIILREASSQKIFFLVKGAEAVMIPRLQPKGSHWLQEECDNFARQGLRTIVLAQKELSEAEYDLFATRYAAARAAMTDRHSKCRREIERLEEDLRLLGLTGVEDKLQNDVPATLEALRHAGVKVWMLTGDKVETATCIAVSAGLKARQHSLTILSSQSIRTPSQTQEALERFAMGPSESVLVVDGRVLGAALQHFPHYFVRVAAQAPAVVCCRCSPTQKADVVRFVKKFTGRRACAVGDGGNDVSMIQAADVGIGIVGKEGRQASLAADFSITQFSHLRRLLLWHGRNAYQRSAKLAQFVIHRGLIIAFIQVIFSAIFYFIPLAIFQGWLQVGYATYYTMAPVFSLVLDEELPEDVVFMFPELYQTLKNGRVLSVKTFFGWVWKSIYQAAVVMMGAVALFENSFTNVVSITFTALILAELLNVASEIQTWHPLMIASEICTVVIYIFSMFILRSYFDITFIMTLTFWAKVTAVTLVSWVPIQIFKAVKKTLQPPQHAKLASP
ncbi:cation-transporting atpase family protein [Toxoplasma gondii TgCatPRC2]|uniref:Phospholipid-transporting ATPase n=5 Tax=Toxoplasma gondii TaxID=5811 RepID=A0A151HQS0_TOXGO|nr:cation-transporting atpase family protein [Toxoplasma gondii ME49]EPT26927.1 cation-transporting atpase family protein [Toxoplasma gondii ME49]KFG45756.1 cation-transporting atpase family protein [Toxoplasma gondii GAB2-2007-GAL-DOM2]KYK71745.1 cation-transporting atpase family protein [Toxoplasma gondii TgCatPRC2]|eukprot:XP_002366104.2 cation-transporting atpase family protein [Toxoplasma gondii ME49]